MHKPLSFFAPIAASLKRVTLTLTRIASYTIRSLPRRLSPIPHAHIERALKAILHLHRLRHGLCEILSLSWFVPAQCARFSPSFGPAPLDSPAPLVAVSTRAPLTSLRIFYSNTH